MSGGNNTSVRIRPDGGAGGIIFRWADAENFFVALVDGATQEARGGFQEIRIEWYKEGESEVFDRFPALSFNNTWGLLTVIDTREGVSVHYNGGRVASVEPGWDISTGRVGLFTNGSGPVIFDDFSLTPVEQART